MPEPALPTAWTTGASADCGPSELVSGAADVPPEELPPDELLPPDVPPAEELPFAWPLHAASVNAIAAIKMPLGPRKVFDRMR